MARKSSSYLSAGAVNAIFNGQSEWRVEKDCHGYSTGIGNGVWTVLHLVPGSVRNKQFADLVVAALNNHSGSTT